MYLVLALPLLMLSFGDCADVNGTQNRTAWVFPRNISVTNGQIWGSWGIIQRCLPGTYAKGFSLKVESHRGIFRDDTALNAIALFCTKLKGGPGKHTTIKSTEGSWGSWRQSFWCSSGVLKAFQLRVEGNQRWRDDTAANNIRFKCSGGQEIEGDGMSWGSWGSWSSDCGGTGICGIQTKVQPNQGPRDDTSLNDVSFICC